MYVVLSMQQLVFATLPCAYNPLLTWVACASEVSETVSGNTYKLLLPVEHVTMLLSQCVTLCPTG